MPADASEVDFEQLLIEHEPDRGNYCRRCGEYFPCGSSWAADKILTLRAARRRREREHANGEAENRG